MSNIPTNKKSKVPPPIPMWVVKAMWRSTAVKFKVPGKTESAAWDRAWKQVAKMDGGDMCLEIKVLGKV